MQQKQKQWRKRLNMRLSKSYSLFVLDKCGGGCELENWSNLFWSGVR